MRVPCVGATLLFSCLPVVAGAQSLTLTESDALARLSDESPRVRVLRAGTDVARAEVLAAGRWPNPRLTFDRESVAGTTENITTVAQPLPITGRRGFEVRAASALVDAASSRADDAVRRVRADLRIAFAQLVAAQTREREMTAARDRLREIVEILAKREAAGDAAGFDHLRAEREIFDLDADRALASIDRTRAQAMLASFFLATDPSTLSAVEVSSTRPEVPTVAALIERAESIRGELVGLRHEREATRLSARAADRRRLPEPEIVAGTKSSSVGSGDVGSLVSVQATLPLFDRGRPERALAEARARQAAARAEVFRLSLSAEIAALRSAVIERRRSADAYRATAISGVSQIERIARVSYEAGERGILELLDAYRTGISASARQAALDLAARQAEIELEFVSGWEMP